MFSSVSDKLKKFQWKEEKKTHKKNSHKIMRNISKPITTQTNTQGNEWQVLDKNSFKFKNKPHMYEQWKHLKKYYI